MENLGLGARGSLDDYNALSARMETFKEQIGSDSQAYFDFLNHKIEECAKNHEQMLDSKTFLTTRMYEIQEEKTALIAERGRLQRPDGVSLKSVSEKGDNKKTPLHDAVMQRHAAVVRELTHFRKLDVNICDRAGYSPLYHAVADGFLEAIAFITGRPHFTWGAPGDPNHISNLLELLPRTNSEKVEELLRMLPE
ncbi:MAG: ankyrin repeat domain-containing protein [Rhabdochlamydiaceae bacterium]|jgi:hypothetical protein